MLSRRSEHYDAVAALTEAQCSDYAEEMKAGITELLEQDQLTGFWKENYHGFFLPDTRIFASDLSDIVSEISPYYRSYRDNINRSCRILYEWYCSPEGEAMSRRISEKLEGYFDPFSIRHGLFEALYCVSELAGRIR